MPFGRGEELVRLTIGLVEAAGNGMDVAADQLLAEWDEDDYMGHPSPDQEAFTPLPVMLRAACVRAVYELVDPESRVRRLMKFIARARNAG